MSPTVPPNATSGEPAEVTMDSAMSAEFADSFARFTREKYSRAAWEAYGRESDGYSIDIWNGMADLGWFALGLPQSFGGMGGGILDLLPLLIEAGHGLWREPLLPTLGECCGALLSLPASESRDRLLKGVIAGKRRLTFLNPQLGSSIAARQRSGDLDGYRAYGTARCVVGAASCSDFLMPIQSVGENQDRLFAIARNAPGVRLAVYPTVDQRRAATIDLHSAPSYLLGAGDALSGSYRRSTILAVAQAVGVMRAAHSMTISYLKLRHQFDQPLIEFQVLQHRLVEMNIVERETTAHLWAVAQAYDRGAATLDRQLLRLRIQSARAARFVTQQAIQLHGGMGITSDSPIGEYYKLVLMLTGRYFRPDAAMESLSALQQERGTM